MIKPKKAIENIIQNSKDANCRNWRLKLDKNENVYGISNLVINAIKNMSFDEINLYSNSDKLLEKLSKTYNHEKNCFLISNSTQEALRLIINTYLEKDEEVLSYNPIDSSCIELQDVCFREIKYSEKYKFNADEIGKYISSNTKILYLSTPDIITGELIKPSVFDILIKKYPNILFVIDCSYINFADNTTLIDYLSLCDKYSNSLVIKSFSYDYALAGANLVFVYAQNAIIENINKIIPENTVNAFAIECGCSALNDKNYLKNVKLNNSNARQMFYKELPKKGFKPYPSMANFILCNFFDFSDYYYQKLKNNSVIVKKFDKDSQYSTCLRITVPKVGGVKFILELLNRKDVLIINPDNVIFDTKESIDYAIEQTFKHFTGYQAPPDKVANVRNLGNYNCAWDIARYMLEEDGYYIEVDEIISIFINFFYNPKLTKGTFLIDKDKMLISKDDLEKLSQKYDLVLFSDRLRMHLEYSINKFEIDKYFHYMICIDDLNAEDKKRSSRGLVDVLKSCPHKTIKYIGANVGDIINGNNANIETIGVINKHSNKTAMMNNFRHLGAKYIIEDTNEILKFLKDK